MGGGRARFEAYLRKAGFEGARVLSFEALGGEIQEDLKAHGYGSPVRARFAWKGEERDVVIRTARPDAFGHDRRADRVYQMALAVDTYRRIPRHVQALDAGTFDLNGAMIPFAEGEPFLIAEYVPGELYAHDLKAIERADEPGARDLIRAEVLASYLADLHSVHATHVDYQRCIRDTLGHGEGIFGITDAYPDDMPVVPQLRLRQLEHACVEWRWKLKAFTHRSRRTHGDFHPFNLLFREPAELSVLDCSRGGVGEPADDVACLSINFLFFALVAGGASTARSGASGTCSGTATCSAPRTTRSCRWWRRSSPGGPSCSPARPGTRRSRTRCETASSASRSASWPAPPSIHTG
ncbi:MAG: aminoglycoside phosphotransferase family protein [Deltaproteobacteria bacterium]|nr:aminoglycoside phosphotransferase family protein [Deltaproteobacteria bacterium]